MGQAVQSVQLQPETLRDFSVYVMQAELEMKGTERENTAFLWADAGRDRAQQVKTGAILAQFWSGSNALEVSHVSQR